MGKADCGPAEAAGGRPLWRNTALRADQWAAIGSTEFEVRAIRYGILDPPSIPFKGGLVLPDIPQTEADMEFGRRDLAAGCAEGVYEEIGAKRAQELVERGLMVSSAFTIWQGEGAEKKGRFVINFSRQSRHWPKGTVKMETVPGFGLALLRNDHLMSWDIKSGYRHFYLHPLMRDFFLFRYAGRFYRCIALPFGWGRSVLWFTKLLRPLVKHIREGLGYRLLPWIDDFLCAPSSGSRPATGRDCRKARNRLTVLFRALGIARHPDKGCWTGTQKIEHLGVLLDTRAMRVYATDRKVARMRALAKELLLSAQRNRRLVSLAKLRHFCGVAVSLSLALPLARFYTRSLYWDMSLRERSLVPPPPPEGGGGGETRAKSLGCRPSGARVSGPKDSFERHGFHRPSNARERVTAAVWESAWIKVRLSRQSLRDLSYWRTLTRGEGRDLWRVEPDAVMHSDAADVGYGGTLGFDRTAGSQGLWAGRGMWEARDRAESITLRELRAVRLLLQRHFADYVRSPSTRKILLHEDNQAVVYILNAMVSSSTRMMQELRRLQAMMTALGVRIEARWLPSAVNRFADALSRQWDPGDVRATETLVRSLYDAYAPEAVVFPCRPTGEHLVARRKYLTSQMAEYWGDGKCRLWNPPFDLLPVVLKKLEDEGGRGVVLAPAWPAQPWFARLRALSSTLHILDPAEHGPLFEGRRDINPEWRLVIAEVGMPTTGQMLSGLRCSHAPVPAPPALQVSQLIS
jgi:hypothetical protein